MSDFLKYLCNPTTIALVLGGILTSLFGVLAGISKSEQTPKWIAWCSFFAGLLVLGAGILSGYQEQRNSELLITKTEQIAKLSQKNAELAENNAKLNMHIANFQTGGNSFCYYEITNPTKQANEISAWRILLHSGRFPIRNLNIRIHDSITASELSKKYGNNITIDTFKETEEKAVEKIHKPIFYKVGQATAGVELIKYFKWPIKRDKQRYSIFFTAINGDWHQDISFRRIKNKWVFASRVTKWDNQNKKKIILLENISDDFPRNDKGEIEW